MRIKSLSLCNEDSFIYTDKIKKLDSLKNSPSGEYTLIPELVILKTIGNNIILFSPLMLRLYFIKKEKYEKLISGNFGNYTQEFIEEYLLVPKNFDIYPQNNEFLLRVSLTGDCNMRCIYCTSRGGESKKSIRMGFVKDTIDYIINNHMKGKPKKKLVIFFSGGEPTLEIDKVKGICNYVKSRIKKDAYSFNITSNGLFPEKIDKWLLNNMDSIAISVDGTPSIQNITRPMESGKASSNIVERTIRRLVKNKPPPKVISVISKYSVDRQTEVINYLNSLGVDRATFTPLRPAGRSLGKNLGYDKHTFTENFLKASEIAEEYGMVLRTNMLNLKEPVNTSCRLGDMLTLTEEGEVIVCQFLKDCLSSVEPSFNQCSIGYYDETNKKLVMNNKKNIKFLSDRNIENIPECGICSFRWLCGGGCPIDAFRKYKDFYRPGKNCKKTIDTIKNYLIYKADRYFLKIKPYMERRQDKFYLSMFFNEFKLNVSKNGKNLKASSIVKIDGSCDFGRLYKNITRETKRGGTKTTLFLLSFDMNLKKYIENLPLIMKLLRKLKSNRIYFKVTKPLPRCLFGSKYSKISEELNIPKSCFECLELFTVRNGKTKMCNGEEGDLNNFSTREEIYDNFKPAKNTTKNCRFCRFYVRKQCNGPCSCGILSKE